MRHYATHHFDVDLGEPGFVPGCGGLIFFVDHQPILGEIIHTDTVRLLDGARPVAGTSIVCGTCGAAPRMISVTLIEVGDLTEYFAAVDEAHHGRPS